MLSLTAIVVVIIIVIDIVIDIVIFIGFCLNWSIFSADNAKVEIAKVRKTRHAVYNINHHLVWIPKTRMKVLVNPFDKTVRETIYRVCAYKNLVPMAL